MIQKELSTKEASLIKGMLYRGDRQSDIAEFFKVNQGRISEVKRGVRFSTVPPSQPKELPPPGPYTIQVIAEHEVTQAAQLFVSRVEDALQAFKASLADLSSPQG